MVSWHIRQYYYVRSFLYHGTYTIPVPVTPPVISTTPPFISTPTPTFCPTYPPGPHLMDCNFDADDLCFWQRVSNLDTIFELRSGATPSFSTGPSNDHTLGNSQGNRSRCFLLIVALFLFIPIGKYIYIETSVPITTGDRAQIRSRVIDASCTTCKLNFWYHMYGTTIGRLTVYMQPTSGTRQQVWTKRGNQGNQWLQANVDLVSNGPYQIIFEAVAGTSFTGDIAIDDITLQNCPPVPTPTPPPPCNPSNLSLR